MIYIQKEPISSLGQVVAKGREGSAECVSLCDAGVIVKL